MPSDARTLRALDALAESRDRYRSAVAAAHDQMAAYLVAHRSRSNGRAHAAAKALGRFGAARIDSERFGALFSDPHSLSNETVERVERLVGVLAGILAEGDDLFVAEVVPGGDLRHTVERALSEIGRAFGAVAAFQTLKSGDQKREHRDAATLALPFAHWNRRERLLAPPLIVEVDGADLRAETLAEYLDGLMTFVLVIRGPSSPVPLVRLVTPGTFVMQTADAGDLASMASAGAPAVAAIVSDGSARFVHDPRGGKSLASRLTVTHLPAVPKQPLGMRSAWQQAEELAQLQALQQSGIAFTAPAPTAAEHAVVGAAPVDAQSVDRLAGWLLTSAGLDPVAGTPGGVAR